MTLGIELDREDDGRWLAAVPDLPADAVARGLALALRVTADRLEDGEAEAALPDLSMSHRRAPSSELETK